MRKWVLKFNYWKYNDHDFWSIQGNLYKPCYSIPLFFRDIRVFSDMSDIVVMGIPSEKTGMCAIFLILTINVRVNGCFPDRCLKVPIQCLIDMIPTGGPIWIPCTDPLLKNWMIMKKISENLPSPLQPQPSLSATSWSCRYSSSMLRLTLTWPRIRLFSSWKSASWPLPSLLPRPP